MAGYDGIFAPGWASGLAMLPVSIADPEDEQRVSGITNPKIPLREGSTYNDPDNTSVEMLAQGHAAGAWPINFNPGIHTPGIFAQCRATPNWFSKLFIDNVILNRNGNGEQNPVDVYWQYGRTLMKPESHRTGWGRVANLSLSASSRMLGPVDVSMNVLLTNQPTLGPNITSTMFDGYPSIVGAPLFFRSIAYAEPTASTAYPNAPIIPNAVEDLSWSIFSGANYAKTQDGTLATNLIDSGIQSGTLYLTQRAAASSLMHTEAVRRIRVVYNFYGTGYETTPSSRFAMEFDLVRLDYTETVVMGNASIASTWGMFSFDGSNPVRCIAIP